MTLVSTPVWSFCIDQYEVTRAQYQAWLDTNPALPGPGAKCGWNDSFLPAASGNECDPTDYDPGNNGDYPVVCVDWCDARAYCQGVGKRLCGKIGDGMSFPYGQFADANVSEWYFACSAGGTQPYPYGNAYDPNVCYGDDHDGIPDNGAVDTPAPIGVKPGCIGGFADIWHMSGNVWEWENACEPDPMAPGDENDRCSDRGGSFWDDQTWLTCDHAPPANHTRNAFNQNVGVRCCSEVPAPPN
jgi:formylglycine-generating enzyme required for sulfatase activity